MLRRVMDVRNRIVANEYGIQLRNSLQYTAERLRDIAPGTLNERQLDNTLWKRYLYPSIDAVTQKIHALSPLEQSYFYALYNFITKELYTSKSGDVELLCYKIIEGIEIAFFQRRKRTQFFLKVINGRAQIRFPETSGQPSLI